MKTIILDDGTEVLSYQEKSINGLIIVTLVSNGDGTFSADRHWYSSKEQAQTAYDTMSKAEAEVISNEAKSAGEAQTNGIVE
jgi:hypothetical protein